MPVVQCKGSGKQAHAGVNAKRAMCPNCHMQKDLTGAGRIKKHSVMLSNAQMRRGR